MTRSCARRGGSPGLGNGALCNDCDLAAEKIWKFLRPEKAVGFGNEEQAAVVLAVAAVVGCGTNRQAALAAPVFVRPSKGQEASSRGRRGQGVCPNHGQGVPSVGKASVPPCLKQ
eukprot:106305-Chlamydomonas_euryale.AAC.1